MSFTKLEKFVVTHELIKFHTTIIVGLSGGPDSVYLLCFLKWLQKKISFNLVAAHLDHEWRKSSKEDALFCKNICNKLDIPFESSTISQLNISFKKSGSQEDLARQYRRFFFEQVRKQYDAHAIAVAHNQDDQLETFFIRLMRGATVTGLSSMRIKQGYYIRPLLHVCKKEILEYLKRKKIDYVIDPTNISTAFLRNRIRLELLPTLQKIDQRAETNILKTINSMQETDDFLKKLALKTLEEICIEKDGKKHLNIKLFLTIDPFLQRRILLEWLYKSAASFTISTALIDEIIRFLHNKKSTAHQFDSWQIKKYKGLAHIIV